MQEIESDSLQIEHCSFLRTQMCGRGSVQQGLQVALLSRREGTLTGAGCLDGKGMRKVSHDPQWWSPGDVTLADN